MNPPPPGSHTSFVNSIDFDDGLQNCDEGDVVPAENIHAFVHIHRENLQQIEFVGAIEEGDSVRFVRPEAVVAPVRDGDETATAAAATIKINTVITVVIVTAAARVKPADKAVLGQNGREKVVKVATLHLLQAHDVGVFGEDLVDDDFPPPLPLQRRRRVERVELVLMAQQVGLREHVEGKDGYVTLRRRRRRQRRAIVVVVGEDGAGCCFFGFSGEVAVEWVESAVVETSVVIVSAVIETSVIIIVIVFDDVVEVINVDIVA